MLICTLSNSDISNDLDGLLTLFSRSRHIWSQISQKRCILGTKLLKNTNRKPDNLSIDTTLNDLEWPLTPITRSQHFSTLNISNDTRLRLSHSYHRTSIGSRMRSIDGWHFQWPGRSPNPVFKVTAFLKSNISNTVHFTEKVSIEH